MEQSNKKSNLFLALFLSLLTALLGGAIFGAIYYTGYYIFIVPLLEIMFCCIVYLKFVNVTKGQLVVSIIWSIIWTFLSNIFAIFVCESIFVAQAYNASIIDSCYAVIELIKTNPDIQNFFITKCYEIIGMILFGALIYSASLAIQFGKQKKEAKKLQAESNITSNKPASLASKTSNKTTNKTSQVKPSTQSKSKSADIYMAAYADCENAVKRFEENLNRTEFKNSMNKMYDKHFSNLDNAMKTRIANIINKLLSKPDVLETDKIINKTLLKLLRR